MNQPSPSLAKPEQHLANESALILECKGGKLESFEPIVRHYQARLGRTAFRVLRDESLAEDAVQMTFVKAWQKISLFREQSAFCTWLYRLCVNTCCDILRHKGRQKEVPFPDEMKMEEMKLSPDAISKWESNPDHEDLRQEMKNLVLQSLARLPEKLRMVLVLREMEGLDYREIARTVKCREGTVISRLFHARRQLRRLVEKNLTRQKFFE